MRHFDRYSWGILLGLLLPALFCYIYLEQFDLWGILRTYHFGSSMVLTKMIILSVFPDMALLFLFYQLDVWKLSKGVLIGSFPYLLAACFFSL